MDDNEYLDIPRFLRRDEREKRAKVSASNSTGLLYGGNYNFKNQPERLKYIGKHKGWHQFELFGKQGVWCELLDDDLHMIEETEAL